MAITTTGGISDTRTTDSLYSVGVGSSGWLTVNGGSVLTIDPINGFEGRMRIGADTTAGVVGTVNLTGAGSMIVVRGGGSTAASAGVNIGRFGRGSMSISAGATLLIEDLIGTTSGPDYNGGEGMNIGRDGQTGNLLVDASTIHLNGTGSYFNVGRDGGNGAVYIRNGSTLLIETSTDTQYDEAGVNVGRGAGGSGSLSLIGSTATVSSGSASAAFVNVGRGAADATGAMSMDGSQMTLTGGALGAHVMIGRFGAGTMRLLRGSTLTLQSSASSGNGTSVTVGRSDAGAGSGTLTVDASTLDILQSASWAGLYVGMNVGSTGATGAATFTRNAAVHVTGVTGAYVSVGLLGGGSAAGVTGGTGTLRVDTGSTLSVTSTGAGAGANFNAGYGAGADGTVIVDSAAIAIAGANAIYINGSSTGAVGTTTLQNAASLSIYATNGVATNLSQLNVNRGSFTMTGGSTLSMRASGATIGGGGVNVQQTGGGAATLSSAASAISGVNNLSVGYAGAGAMTVTGGSVGLVSNVSNNSYTAANVSIGGQGGAGSLTLTGGAVLGVDQFANMMVGVDYSTAPVNPTTGTVTVDGATLSLAAVGAALNGAITVGQGSSATGVFNIFGATATVNRVANVSLGSSGGSGSMTIDAGRLNLAGNGGASAMITVGSYNAASTGSLTVSNGGSIVADASCATLNVGQYAGGSGTVNVLSGGAINLGWTSGSSVYNSVYVGSAVSSGSSLLSISGAGSSVSGVQYVNVNGAANAAGVLRVAAGGVLSAQYLSVGSGGSVEGSGGAVNAINNSFWTGSTLGDSGGAIQTMTFNGQLSLAGGSTMILDANATTNDRYAVSGSFGASGAGSSLVNFLVNPVSGVTFATGARRIFVDVQPTAIVTMSGLNVAVQGQHADFGYFFGSFADTRDVGLLALNSGATGGLATLNFGAASTTSAWVNYDATTGTGNATGGAIGAGFIRNVDIIYGSSVADNLYATGSANMRLYGRDGADTLTTGAGADILDGGTGSDSMTGGAGNDIYYVDGGGDSVSESVGGGSDQVWVSGAFYTLAAGTEIERLRAADVAATAGLTLIGNEFGQELIGNAGANMLDGRGGADWMTGFAGDDAYYVDNAGDRAYEAAGGGYDSVIASVDWVLAAGQEVENLGASASAMSIRLTGNAYAQTITGTTGTDVLNGGGGVDTMTGYGGNDTYFVDNAADVVQEAAGYGSDTVVATANYTLAAGQAIEILRTYNSAYTSTLRLIGNEFGQTVAADSGANWIDGGAGSDYLIGYGGADTFAFSTALGATNVDSISGFELGIDRIALSASIFGTAGAAGATLAGDVFVTGAAATTSNHHIVYNSANGLLYYDADGVGGAAQQAFARIGTGLALTASSFSIV